jgi:hypothetical protein
MHVDGERRRGVALGETLLAEAEVQQRAAEPAELLSDGKRDVVLALQRVDVLERERVLAVVLVRAGREVVGERRRDVEQSLCAFSSW